MDKQKDLDKFFKDVGFKGKVSIFNKLVLRNSLLQNEGSAESDQQEEVDDDKSPPG